MPYGFNFEKLIVKSADKLCRFEKVVSAFVISILSVTEYKICHKSWVFVVLKKDLSTSIFAIAF